MNTRKQLEFDFVKPNQLTLNFDNNVYFGSTNSLELMTITKHHTLLFTNEHKQIGKLDWKDGVMKFEGDADESAQLFFDNIIKRFVQMQLPLDTKTSWKS